MGTQPMNIKRDYSKPLFGRQAKQRNYGRLFFIFGTLIGGLLVFVSVNFTQLQSTALEVAGFGPTPTPLPGDLATVGAQMMAIGNFDEAADMFERVLDVRPENVDYMYAYGDLLVETRDYEYALEMAERMLRASPSDPRGYELKARTQVFNGSSNAAISVALAGIDLGQGYRAPLYATLSRAYVNVGNYVDAVDAGVRAVENDPNSVDARLAYANALNFFDLRDEALAELELAASLDPNDTSALFDLAFQYLARDRDQEAIDLYDRILALQPRNARANLWLCRSYKKIGQFDRAMGYCADSVAYDDTSAPAFYELGTLHYRDYNFAGALDAFSRCMALNPDSLECTYRTGLSYYYVAVDPLTGPDMQRDYCDTAWQTLQDSLVMAQARFGVDNTIETIRTGLVAVGADCPGYGSDAIQLIPIGPEVTPEPTLSDTNSEA